MDLNNHLFNNGALKMLRTLSEKEKEKAQRGGYMCEHLLCLYSMVSDQTALYDDEFPVFLNSFGEVDVILFGLGKKDEKRFECLQELVKLPINTLNIVSPVAFQKIPSIRTRYVDWDFHINVDRFDFDLKGRKYKDIRYRLRQADEMGYSTKLSRNFTPNHTYILSRHMARYKLDVWDYEELLSLERFFMEHEHGLMMEVYLNDRLIGFDVIDFFEDSKIMVVPLEICLEAPLVSDFLMHENLKFARDRGHEWVDVGPACGNPGIRRFKEKWFAKPKYQLFVQTLRLSSEKWGFLNRSTLNLKRSQKD